MSGTWTPGPGPSDGDDSYLGGAGSGFDGPPSAGAGNDTMVAQTTGNSQYDGGEGNDSLIGGPGADQLTGGIGNDTLIGNAGNDILNGGEGDDWLEGGSDSDQVNGGPGADTIHVVENPGGGLLTGDAEDSILVEGESIVGSTSDPGATDYTIFELESDGEGGWDTIGNFQVSGIPFGNVSVVCFAEGTRIATAAGEVPVEALRAGDLVVSPGAGGVRLQPVVWVGHARAEVARHPEPAKVAPVRIGAGALGEGVPFRDLRVSPDHAIFLDGHLVPAKYLVNGTSIVQETWHRSVRYWHIELPVHGLLVSEGAVTESYFDDGNRQRFDNLDVTVLFGDFAAGARYDVEACCPVLRDGPLLDALRARIALRAEALGMCRAGRRAGPAAA